MKKLLLAISLLAFAACKKQPAPSGPKLGAPEAGGYTRELAPAAATVTASSGPVKITLQVAKTTILESDGSLWVKLTLENIGTTHFAVSSLAFIDGPMDLWYRRNPLSLQFGEEGEEPYDWLSNDEELPEGECWPGDSGKRFYRDREPALWNALQFGGEQTLRRLVEKGVPPRRWGTLLKPGESITTPPYAYQTLFSAWCEKQPSPKPVGDFGEIPIYGTKPGKYRLRAVYEYGPASWDEELTKVILKSGPLRPENVSFQTPWITITVSEP
ncbi:MAG: hypothetical protein CO113_13270 [Elusimicrobia bacterium CG_4_9_14_3_um_filter_62_55]|nr:MAG: hypothetical protein COR54_17170 [Elusimicrobia bacterium CG22_combo_CG10-13_8_21_14_all_63_91]PJA17179.1 MAG: hypothetical protein COX66_05365 [Elusimicrobia bacterium CG_4_10_14_0_2_um_filter_63_34]PJB24547.1 MAG: hypothetical protein CO113_13270 [Elusimicrobia bacterium CG_4_9_14_3_um_filter_62_55]